MISLETKEFLTIVSCHCAISLDVINSWAAIQIGFLSALMRTYADSERAFS